MSLASTQNRNDYVGAGNTATYPYGFKVFADTDLLVTVRNTSNVETTLSLTTDYTVTGVGNTPGGNVVLVSSGQAWLTGGFLTTGYALTIRRVRPLTQETDLRNGGEYFPEVVEDEFDRGVMIAQQLKDGVDRSFRLPETVSPAVVSALLPVPVAASALRWNAGATALENYVPASAPNLVMPAGTGIAVVSAPQTLIARTIVAGDGSIAVTNGTGVSGNPSIVVPALGITTAKINDLAVTTGKIDDLGVTAGKIATDAVETAKIKDANVTLAKLLHTVGDGQVFKRSGTAIVGQTVAGITVLATGAATIGASQTETTILTATVSAGLMGTNGSLRFRVVARFLSDGANTLNLKLSLGGTVIFDLPYVLGAASTGSGLNGELTVGNLTASAQRCYFWSNLEGGGAYGAAPVSAFNGDLQPKHASALSMIDTSVDRTFTATLRWIGAQAENPSVEAVASLELLMA